jgi:ABC-type branched-subunit amino acid transport system substrate-binding protein
VNKTWRSALAAIVGLGLVATACGSSDGGGAATETTAGATTAAPTTAAGTATTAGGTDTTGAATTAAASGEKFGKQADGTYLGKGGFKIDTSKCPGDWDIEQGITDTEINLFMSLAKSGPLAGFGLIADGADSYFKLINEQGGAAGRKIVLESKDDVYQADKTKANVDEAIAARKHAALFVTLGTPNNLAVWDTTNKECMPHRCGAVG